MPNRPTTFISIRKLKPSKTNARTHSRRQVKQIANSIVRFGWTYPILVDDGYGIIAGHGRYLAAIESGVNEVPVIIMTGLSSAERRALAIADNKIAINSGWDRATLAAELGELSTLLPDCNLDLGITGFEPAEFDLLCSDFTDPDISPADELPEITTSATSQMSDLWLLGPLACSAETRASAPICAHSWGSTSQRWFSRTLRTTSPFLRS